MPNPEGKELSDLMLRFSSPLHSTPDPLPPLDPRPSFSLDPRILGEVVLLNV